MKTFLADTDRNYRSDVNTTFLYKLTVKFT